MKNNFYIKFVLIFIALIVTNISVSADQYTTTISAKTWSAYGDQTLNGVVWNASATGGAFWGFDSGKGQQFGSAANSASLLNISTTGIAGNVTSVKVITSGATSTFATLSVKVGGTNFTNSGNQGVSISSTSATYEFTGNASGKIELIWSQSSAKAIYFKGVEISYITSPYLTVSTSSLSDFKYYTGSGPSVEQSFTLTGSLLTANVTLTAPTNYEISTTAGSGYGSTISLTPTGNTLSSTTIYARMKAGLNTGTYNNENIIISSAGAANQTVSCSGEVSVFNPGISVAETSISAMTTSVGTSISETSNINGTNLSGDITVSISGPDATFFSINPSTISQNDGNNSIIGVTTTYHPSSAGSHYATLELSSPGATSVIKSLIGNATAATLATPTALAATEIKAFGYNANWNSVNQAEKYLLNIYVTNNGGVSYDPISGSPFTIFAPNTSYIVSGLTPNTTYKYTLTASNNLTTSSVSNAINVTTLTDTRLHNHKIENISASNGTISFDANEGENIEIYNSIGQKIYQNTAKEGINTIKIKNAKGATVVKVGTKTATIVL